MKKQTSPLRVCVIQTNLYWENKALNLRTLGSRIMRERNADVIVLPEMFTTGFSMNTKLAETMEGETLIWMKTMAGRLKSAICGSLMLKEGRKFVNRFVWVMPNGETYIYDKRHLFSPAGENNHYSPGQEKIIINYKGWNICPLICYDLRFPVWSRSINNEVDLYIYVANWPKPRVYAWQQLLIARSIENQAYVVGANRTGKDGKGMEHNGHSMIIDYTGKPLAKASTHVYASIRSTLDHDKLSDFRKKLPFYMDADKFEIKKAK